MAKRTGIIAEFIMFMRQHKAYWLMPIVIAIFLLAGIILLGSLGGGAAAPFIYTLF